MQKQSKAVKIIASIIAYPIHITLLFGVFILPLLGIAAIAGLSLKAMAGALLCACAGLAIPITIKGYKGLSE